MLTNTFNWWTIIAPIGLLLALLLGWLSVRRKLCHVYNLRIEGVAVIGGIISAICFAVMVFRESFVGAVDLAIRLVIAPGESEVPAIFVAIVGIIFTACLYGVAFGILCCFGNWLHAKVAEFGARRQRELCRKAKADYQLMEKVVKKCQRATPGHGYCKVGSITGAYEPKQEQGDIPDLTEAQRARIEAAATKPDQAKTINSMWSSMITLDLPANKGIDPSALQAKPQAITPKAVIAKQHARQLRLGLTQAQEIFAKQAAAGESQICVLTLADCHIRFNPDQQLSKESEEAWGAFIDAQNKPLDLPHVG